MNEFTFKIKISENNHCVYISRCVHMYNIALFNRSYVNKPTTTKKKLEERMI